MMPPSSEKPIRLANRQDRSTNRIPEQFRHVSFGASGDDEHLTRRDSILGTKGAHDVRSSAQRLPFYQPRELALQGLSAGYTQLDVLQIGPRCVGPIDELRKLVDEGSLEPILLIGFLGRCRRCGDSGGQNRGTDQRHTREHR